MSDFFKHVEKLEFVGVSEKSLLAAAVLKWEMVNFLAVEADLQDLLRIMASSLVHFLSLL